MAVQEEHRNRTVGMSIQKKENITRNTQSHSSNKTSCKAASLICFPLSLNWHVAVPLNKCTG